MRQDVENQIQVLESTTEQPTRFCFEFPLHISLFHYFLSKGQQCLTYKQEVLLNGLLSGTSFLYKVKESIHQSLIQASLIGVIQHVLNQKESVKKAGAVLIVSHNIKLFQQLVRSFEDIAEHTNITYVVVDQRPKGILPEADVVLLLSTYFQVVLSLISKPVTLCLSTDIIATKVNNVLQKNENCQVVGFFTHDNDLQSWNSTQKVEIVEIREGNLVQHYNANLSENEDLKMWVLRTILDHFENSISVVCINSEQAQDMHAFLLVQGLASLLLEKRERKHFIDKHIRLLKRRLYDVVVSTEVQKSADIQIVLSPISVAKRQKAIFVRIQSSDEQILEQEDVMNEDDIIQTGNEEEEEQLKEEEGPSNKDGEERLPKKLPVYNPPTLSEARETKERSLLFRLLKRQGSTNGVLYKGLAEEIIEHPQSLQLIATLLQDFDIQSLSYDKFEKLDRKKIEQNSTGKPERKENHSRSKPYRRRNYRRR